MNKILVTLSFLISVICISSQSWGLPPCPSTGIKDNCHGTLTSKKGGKYEGEFKDNKKNGQGTYTFGGQKYVGTWVDGKEHGKGVFTWADGDKYIGDFIDGEFNGQGVLTYKNGTKYEGEWKDGYMTEKGTYTYENGTTENFRETFKKWKKNKGD